MSSERRARRHIAPTTSTFAYLVGQASRPRARIGTAVRPLADSRTDPELAFDAAVKIDASTVEADDHLRDRIPACAPIGACIPDRPATRCSQGLAVHGFFTAAMPCLGKPVTSSSAQLTNGRLADLQAAARILEAAKSPPVCVFSSWPVSQEISVKRSAGYADHIQGSWRGLGSPAARGAWG